MFPLHKQWEIQVFVFLLQKSKISHLLAYILFFNTKHKNKNINFQVMKFIKVMFEFVIFLLLSEDLSEE